MTRWFSWLAVLFFVATFSRAAWLQIGQHDALARAAERNRMLRQVIRAPRGQILDRNGEELATNTLRYSQSYTQDNQLRQRLIDKNEALAQMATAPATVRTSYERTYPFGPVTAHLVGYVDQPRESEAVVQGRSGIERLRQDQLAGQDGLVVYERNAYGEATRVLSQQSAQAGAQIKLTVDAGLSEVAWKALGARRGAVIVGVPQTGEILAIVSSPSFIPEAAPRPESTALWQEQIDLGSTAQNLVDALDFPANPFLFRPMAAQYPPGSIFKIVTALAALEYEAITTRTQVRDEGVLKVGDDFSYANWYWRQFGRVEGDINVVRAIARSNDIFFYKAAEWVGPDRLAQFARLFSLGQPTQTMLTGERAGIIPDPAWKQRQFGERWFLGNTYHMGIGQGDVLTTPIQLHTLMSTVTARGRQCAPQFFMGEQASCSEISLNDGSLIALVQGMRQACSPGGTAYPFFETSYDVMCKTGTAEFGEADEQGHRPTHGWFTAAVSHEPRREGDVGEFKAEIVITVLVESDDQKLFREGSADAAPVAKEIVDWWLENR